MAFAVAEAAKAVKANCDKFGEAKEEEVPSMMEEFVRLLDALCQNVGSLEASAKAHSVVIT